MHLHFYASMETIDGINQGRTMIVGSIEFKAPGDIHVSFDTNLYDVEKGSIDGRLYKVTKKKKLWKGEYNG